MADPARWHPVSGFGRTAIALERVMYRDSRWSGVLHAGMLVGGAAGLGVAADRGVQRAGWAGEVAGTAVATWVVLGGTSLGRTGATMARHLESDDLTAARALLPSLCGRDPSALGADGLARAALESVAENTADAAVGALVWGALAGIPGLFAYRATNTLDAMVGYRSPKYRNFGWSAARWDDVVNLLPARVTGALTVVAAPTVGGSAVGAWQSWRCDASGHPSPNAGVAEASAAGALGVSLGGRTEYAHGVEMRPRLGSGHSPEPADLDRGVRLSAVIQGGAALVSAVLAVAVGQLDFRRRSRR
ncbi:adenosylcobinamide-phosphate synthase [Rhodococcus sp. WMMA185]|nr:adenosylcobinamide-phosphate synthase [Rhodococcus sp. WMMA185]